MPTRIIYVHGMGGSPEDWLPVQKNIAGLSLPLDAKAGSPAKCGARLAEEILAQVSGAFCLCGYSMGGRMSILAAEELIKRGKKPDGLVLVSTGFGSPSDAERTARIRSDDAWATLAEEDTEAFWRKWYEQELFASFRALPEARREAWLESRKTMNIEDLSAQLRFLGPGHHEDLLPKLRDLASRGVRTLYIAGNLDKKYAELAQKVAEIPGLIVELLPGAGHILPLEAPEALGLRIRKFVQ